MCKLASGKNTAVASLHCTRITMKESKHNDFITLVHDDGWVITSNETIEGKHF